MTVVRRAMTPGRPERELLANVGVVIGIPLGAVGFAAAGWAGVAIMFVGAFLATIALYVLRLIVGWYREGAAVTGRRIDG